MHQLAIETRATYLLAGYVLSIYLVRFGSLFRGVNVVWVVGVIIDNNNHLLLLHLSAKWLICEGEVSLTLAASRARITKKRLPLCGDILVLV